MRFIDFLLSLLFVGLMAFIYWQWSIVKNNPIEKEQQNPGTVQDSLRTDTISQDTTFWKYDTLAISQYLDNLIVEYKDTFPDTVVERLWGMMDSTVKEYPFSEYVKYNNDVEKENFYRLINLDEDKEKELLIQFHEYKNIVYVLDRDNGVWKEIGIERYEPVAYYGTGNLPGELTLYPKQELISIKRSTNYGSSGNYQTTFYKLVRDSLKIVLLLEEGYFNHFTECGAASSTNLDILSISEQQIKAQYTHNTSIIQCKDTSASLIDEKVTALYEFQPTSYTFELQDSIKLQPYEEVLKQLQKDGTPLQKELIKEHLKIFPPKENE